MRTTALARISVGVTVERRKARSAWADFLWRPVSVFTGSPSAAPWTPLGMEAETTLFYAGEAAIELHRTETSSYRDNLASGAPALWIVLRLTASELPYELVAEQVPMPPDIAEIVGQFVAQHHIDRPFVKRRRDGQTLPDRKERTSSD